MSLSNNEEKSADYDVGMDSTLDESIVPDHKYPTRHKTNLMQRQQSNLVQQVERKPCEVLLSWTELIERRGKGRWRSFISSNQQPSPPDIDSEDKADPLSVHEYANDIVPYYRRVESHFSVPENYMSFQIDINAKMRSILIDWLVEVHLKFKLMPETLYLTVSCIDRFLTKKQASRKNLQLVGVAAMLIASKYEEIWAPEIRDFIFISDKAYSREQIIAMEKNILNTLDFELTVPTGYIFLQRFLKAANADSKVSMLSQYLLELTLVDYNMLKYPCSQIAAVAVYMANMCAFKPDFWSEALEIHAQYRLEDLQRCTMEIARLQKKAPGATLKAVFKKSSVSKFKKVTELCHFEDLIRFN